MLIDLDGHRDLLRCGIEPGASPFKIKGMAYRGHLDYVARKIDGGLEAFAGATESEDPKLRAFFFDQNFVPSAFYDILPLVIAGIICGKMTGKRFLDFVHERDSKAEPLARGPFRPPKSRPSSQLPRFAGRGRPEP